MPESFPLWSELVKAVAIVWIVAMSAGAVFSLICYWPEHWRRLQETRVRITMPKSWFQSRRHLESRIQFDGQVIQFPIRKDSTHG